jgi:hypothetical protein
MERKYILKSDNPILDGTTVTITGKCLAEIKIKADRMMAKAATTRLISISKKGVLS